MQIILNPQLLWGHHILSAKLGHISTIKVWAVSNKHNAIVELLLDCSDIDVNIINIIIIIVFTTTFIIINIINKVWAVSNKHNAIVELLLDCPDIDVNCQDRMGNTPLHAAVEVS